MSSPTETAAASTSATADKIPSDFTHCVQKLLSSVSTLSKHLAQLTTYKETTGHNEELTRKLQVRRTIERKTISLLTKVRTKINLDRLRSMFESIFNLGQIHPKLRLPSFPNRFIPISYISIQAILSLSVSPSVLI